MVGNKVRLRALTPEDAQITWKWRNQPEIKEYFSGHPFNVSYEHEKVWYERNLSNDLPHSTFGIEVLDTGQLVGMFFLKNINLIHRNAELAIFIGEREAQGKGFAYDAMITGMRFGFYDLGIHRIHLKVQEQNTGAVKLYQKCGFKTEGMIRESVYKSGEYRNELWMAILKPEFRMVENQISDKNMVKSSVNSKLDKNVHV